MSQYCRFSGGKNLEFSLMFKLSENSDFSCGTESGAFFSVKGSAIGGAENYSVPARQMDFGEGQNPLPVKGRRKMDSFHKRRRRGKKL